MFSLSTHPGAPGVLQLVFPERQQPFETDGAAAVTVPSGVLLEHEQHVESEVGLVALALAGVVVAPAPAYAVRAAAHLLAGRHLLRDHAALGLFDRTRVVFLVTPQAQCVCD